MITELLRKKSRTGKPADTSLDKLPLKVTYNAIHSYLEALDCPRSLAISILVSSIAAGNDDDSIELESLLDVDPLWYQYAEDFRQAYVAAQFLSKNRFIPTHNDKKARAFEKFERFEAQCARTNERLTTYFTSANKNATLVALHHGTFRKICKILGKPISAEEFFEWGDWGPGVTQALKSNVASKPIKYRQEVGISRDLLEFLKPLFPKAYPLWADYASLIETAVIQNTSKVITVPKKWDIDRVISVEPGFNLFFQKSLGKYIRRGLGRCGIDLNSQKRNQELARYGSITGRVATVDFSSASDSNAYKLIESLIPNHLFQLLEITRTKYRVKDGKAVKWAKYSSMGNGFTFELESLIYYAAACTVCEHLNISQQDISVYGDDVIIPTEAYSLFRDFAEFLGFTVNTSKTFSSGWFRESCGSHYFGGLDCKPIFLKEKLHGLNEVVKLANNVRRMAHRYRINYGCDSRFLRCWRHLLRIYPSSVRLKISEGFGDGGFISNLDEATPPRHKCFDAWVTKHRTQVAMEFYDNSAGTLLSRLRDIRGSAGTKEFFDRNWSPGRSYGNNYNLRERYRQKISRLIVADWYDLGPWT